MSVSSGIEALAGSTAQSDLMSYLQGLAGGDPLFSPTSGSGSVVVTGGDSTTIAFGSGPSQLGGGTTAILFH
jgi:hypothetical protein